MSSVTVESVSPAYITILLRLCRDFVGGCLSPALPRRVAPVRPPLRAFVTAALSRQGGDDTLIAPLGEALCMGRRAVRVPERQLLRATHSCSGSRTGCLALSWPSVRVRFLILGDILSYFHTALSFPKFSPKSWPRRSAADLVVTKAWSMNNKSPLY